MLIIMSLYSILLALKQANAVAVVTILTIPMHNIVGLSMENVV